MTRVGSSSVHSWQQIGRRFLQRRLNCWALMLIILLILLAILAPLLSPYPRDLLNLAQRNQGLSSSHWLGTDGSGRDVLTRLLYATRVSLLVGFTTALIAVSLGLSVGAISGYSGGLIDALLMRLVDVVLSFPYFVLALALTALLQPGLVTLILVTSLLGWPPLARLVRAEVISLKQCEFIEAARALGLNHFTIIVHHILPNVLPPVFVYSTIAVARGIMAEAALSFLGLGVQIPTPSWGNMLASSQDFITFTRRWWQWLPPGLMVSITVLAVTWLGEGLRKAFDLKQSSNVVR